MAECISIIIPALNEANTILQTLRSTQNAMSVEQIVVDGGSRDETVQMARRWGARVLASPAGRARQMNSGAQVASGKLLLFLHADTRLPEGFDNHVRQAVVQPGIIAGAFQLRIDAASPGLRLIEGVTNWRSRTLQLPYGDQAIFLKADSFRDLGGFSNIPILEDFDLVCRLRRRGKIVIVPAAAATSARRWKKLGVWRTTLINQIALLAYCLGVRPSRIARWYYRDGFPK